jgi:membrane dipeptidase
MNATIKTARDHALEQMKPSQRDLEHGLELHRESFVGEAYGFSPGGGIDSSGVKALVDAGASDLEIQDYIEELAMTRWVLESSYRDEALMAWEAAGVDFIFQNAGEECQSIPQILKRLARFNFATDIISPKVQRVVSPEDISTAKKENRRCISMSTNGVPIPEKWVTLEEELSFVRIFFQLGVRMMHLTYNRRNMIGDGCMEEANAGLSDFGRAVISEMNRVGVLVDVAHSGLQTSFEAAKASNKPIVASHTSCDALFSHRRTKTDEVMKAIVETGGYIGIYAVPSFLGGTKDINAMLNHIDYVAKKFGPEHVAIGTDIVYSSDSTRKERGKLGTIKPKSRPRWENFWPKGSINMPLSDLDNLSLSWTNWPLFTVGLVQRGYSDADIQKIIGGNILRVISAVWPYSSARL